MLRQGVPGAGVAAVGAGQLHSSPVPHLPLPSPHPYPMETFGDVSQKVTVP